MDHPHPHRFASDLMRWLQTAKRRDNSHHVVLSAAFSSTVELGVTTAARKVVSLADR